MGIQDELLWPDMFEKNILDFSNEMPKAVLAMQLVTWGNILMGCKPPKNFFEVMDAASKVTGAFTPNQCMAMSDNFLGDDNEDQE
jgi:hypothetical protein